MLRYRDHSWRPHRWTHLSGAFARRLPVGRKWHALKSSNLAFSLSPFPANALLSHSPAGSRSVARATEQHCDSINTQQMTLTNTRDTHIYQYVRELSNVLVRPARRSVSRIRRKDRARRLISFRRVTWLVHRPDVVTMTTTMTLRVNWHNNPRS